MIKSIVRSHKRNEKMENRINIKDFLGETVNVKLPSTCAFDADDVNLSSSPLRPASVHSDNDGSIVDDSIDTDYNGVKEVV